MSRCLHWKTAGWFMLFSAILIGCASDPANQQANNAATAEASAANDPTKPALKSSGSAENGTTANPRVHEFMLDNGMKVLVKQDHRAPVVVSQVWYKAGSSYEQNGSTGVAHVLEHMMFKGTDKYGPNEFSRIISENGGRENAFTGQDYTAYFQQLEKSRLPISMAMKP